MRRIWSVTGVLGLLIAGAVWVQAAEDIEKSMDGNVADTLSFMLDRENTDAVQGILKSLTRQGTSGAVKRLSVFFHTDDTQTFQQTLDTIASAQATCLQVGPSRFDCSVLTGFVRELAAQLDFTWMGWLPPSTSNVGSVTSTGDDAMRASDLRARLGVDGSGVNIGIISDGLVDLQASVDSGDLPENVQIVNGRDGNDPSNIDEGRAMAEIIHDLAPGANLFFHTGAPSSVDMIAAIEGLTAVGSHIIVDDLGFPGEPVFEDGPVAQAVQAAISQGVVYITSAGNAGMRSYHAMYRELNPNDGVETLNVHDFGGGDGTLAVRIAPGSSMLAVLQWANRFDGRSSTADYDLRLLDASATVDACTLPGLDGSCRGQNPQLLTTAPPLEAVVLLNNTGAEVTVNLEINRYEGEALPLQIFFFGGVQLEEHGVSRSSTFGHPCISEALAVGAIDASDPGFDTIEDFSSQGPCNIYFPTRETRFKPDVAGADGVNTSLPFFTPFFGTSASAPHVAAVAALLMEIRGGPDEVTPSHIRNLLRLGATDLGAVGPDTVYGYGVVDAEQTANLLQNATDTAPQGIIESPAEDIVIAPGELPLFQGTCVDADEVQTPFTFSWDFGGGAAASSQQSPGATIFADPGTFTISFTCTDATGLSDPTPDIRTVIVNRV